jgi:hypothetical protein
VGIRGKSSVNYSSLSDGSAGFGGGSVAGKGGVRRGEPGKKRIISWGVVY